MPIPAPALFYVDLSQERIDGNIGFKDAEFSYPTRQQVSVLKSLNLSLTPGQKIALVGPSGCGKSTCVQLLQRFYNLHSGEMVTNPLNSFWQLVMIKDPQYWPGTHLCVKIIHQNKFSVISRVSFVRSADFITNIGYVSASPNSFP